MNNTRSPNRAFLRRLSHTYASQPKGEKIDDRLNYILEMCDKVMKKTNTVKLQMQNCLQDFHNSKLRVPEKALLFLIETLEHIDIELDKITPGFEK